MNSFHRARHLASDHQRLVAGVLLLAGCLYLVPFVDRGWVPLDEGMVGQAAERVLNGQLPHVDYEEPYPGALSYAYAAVFRIGALTCCTCDGPFLLQRSRVLRFCTRSFAVFSRRSRPP